MDSLYKQGARLNQAETTILTTCVRQGQETDSAVQDNQKILPCTANEVQRLLLLIAQHSTKQELIRIAKSNIEKARIDLNYAVSAGKNQDIAKAQLSIQRYTIAMQSDLGAVDLIEKEFKALNSGCSNSKLSLD